MASHDSALKSLATYLKPVTEAQASIVRSNPQLDHALNNSKDNDLPPIYVGPAHGTFLSIMARAIGAKSILEIGTLGGYSTIWLAQSSPDVKVTSIEFDSKHHAVATENTRSLGNVEIILGAALDVLPKLAEQGKVFDLVFIDALWEEQQQYFDWAVKLTRKNGLIYVDNVVREILEDDAAGMALIEHIRGDSRVEASLIPTLQGQKEDHDELVDGFVLATVK